MRGRREVTAQRVRADDSARGTQPHGPSADGAVRVAPLQDVAADLLHLSRGGHLQDELRQVRVAPAGVAAGANDVEAPLVVLPYRALSQVAAGQVVVGREGEQRGLLRRVDGAQEALERLQRRVGRHLVAPSRSEVVRAAQLRAGGFEARSRGEVAQGRLAGGPVGSRRAGRPRGAAPRLGEVTPPVIDNGPQLHEVRGGRGRQAAHREEASITSGRGVALQVRASTAREDQWSCERGAQGTSEETAQQE